MSTELIVNASLPETRIALMENGEIQEILIERAQGKGIVGNIYKGRVTRVLPGMQAAFVDIGLEKAAFLYVDDVFVHSEIWEEEEGKEEAGEEGLNPDGTPSGAGTIIALGAGAAAIAAASAEAGTEGSEHAHSDDHEEHESGGLADEFSEEDEDEIEASAEEALGQHPELLSEEEAEDQMAEMLADDEDEEDEDGEPVGMGAEGDDENPAGTVSPKAHANDDASEGGNDDGFDDGEGGSSEGGAEGGESSSEGGAAGEGAKGEGGRRRRRGRRGGRNRRRDKDGAPIEGVKREVKKIELKFNEDGTPVIATAGAVISVGAGKVESSDDEAYPEPYYAQVSEETEDDSDRASLGEVRVEANQAGTDGIESNRPEGSAGPNPIRIGGAPADGKKGRPEFKEPRSRDRKIRSKQSMKPSRMNVNIQDLLKEGQEVIVQIAKDPIATKGARLTCHISLPGRHLVCMPTIDHVGVSRRIEKDEERRRLREYVDRNRPKGLGFIVRTATSSGKAKAEARIKQDIDYLSALWNEIKSKANEVSAPALVYEDLNPVLRAIRDWVNEDIDKIVVDSRYHYNDVQRFLRNFMPGVQSKAELYAGDVPIFDAYGISSELARALERKVWLKSGGYLVVDQAEALVAIDVNTGRYVGKKNLEDTILKTNLEAVKEIAYQLRIRNCGGIIILDLIDMEREENKLRVYRALEEELKKDRSRPQILKISELGLVEMTRKRTRDTMVRALCDSCPNCEGKGYIKSKLTVAYEILRDIEREGADRDSPKILVQAHPDVIDTLAIDERDSLDQLERRFKKQVYLQAVADHHLEQFELIGDKRTTAGRSEESLLERARELAQTSDPRRSRRGRDRNRGKSGGRDGGREGGREGGDRDQKRSSSRNDRGGRDGGREGGREGGDRSGGSAAGSNRPRISIRIGGASAEGEEGQPNPDTENNENRISVGIRPREDGAGHSEGIPMGTPGAEDGMNEEDRLAYQRAQAAQDAALAAGVPINGNVARPGQRPAGGGKWGKGGQPAAGGGRGEAGRGPKGRGGRRGRFQKGFKGEGAPAAPAGSGGGITLKTAAPEGSGGSGGGESAGGNGDTGGGDRSNPPS